MCAHMTDLCNALSGEEMKTIVTTPYADGKNPCSCVPGPQTDPSLLQWQRNVKPIDRRIITLSLGRRRTLQTIETVL